MKDIEKALKCEYCDALSEYKFSDKRKLYKLYTTAEHTPVIRKIAISYAVLIAVMLIFAITAAAAVFTLYDAVAARTKDLDITDEKREEMVENLETWGTTPEEFASTQYDIGVNENGDTYGYLFDGVDLIAVGGYGSDSDVTGYVYNDDFAFINMDVTEGAKSIEDILKNQQDRDDGKVRNWIYVYDSDGYTVIGKYILEYSSDSIIYGELTEEERDRILEERFYEREARLGDFEYGFNTNEQLKNPEYQKFIIDGSDYRKYVQMAQNRSTEIKIKQNNTDTE